MQSDHNDFRAVEQARDRGGAAKPAGDQYEEVASSIYGGIPEWPKGADCKSVS